MAALHAVVQGMTTPRQVMSMHVSIVCGMQAERGLRVKAELEAADAKKTAEVDQVAATQRLQEQLESTMAETKRAAVAESELADSNVELQAALRAVQVSFGFLLFNEESHCSSCCFHSSFPLNNIDNTASCCCVLVECIVVSSIANQVE